MKHVSQFTIIITGFVLLLVLISAAVYFAGTISGLAQPILDVGASAKIAMTSPVGVIFPQEMDTQSVETRISTDPAVPLKFNWLGRKLLLSPETAFPADTQITLTLKSGASSSDGHRYESDSYWQVKIRVPRIVFIGQATTSPEIWLYDLESASVQPLTATGGKVTGFSPYPDGSAVLFTRKNEQGGADIHLINSDGTDERILVNCGTDTCRDAAVDSAAQRIAFARNQKPGGSVTSQDYYIYIFDIPSGQVTALYPQGEIHGVAPNWSPDGKKMAFYDRNSLGIRIRNDNGDIDFLLGSVIEQTGCWSPDSQKFIFIDEIVDVGFAYSRLYEVDINSSTITQPLGDQFGLEEYGAPAWSPDGKSLAMGVRQNNAGVSKQIWLFDLANKTRSAITSGFAYSNAVPQWRPDGNALVFQQAQLGSSGVKPAIIVWDKAENTLEAAASDGALPAWLP